MTPATSSQPTRFRCKVGGEWKDLADFSNAQQRKLLTSGRRAVDPAHSGMTCKQHSAGSRTEMRCDVCMLVKPVDEFSKNSRRNGESTCRRCTAWTEIQEPGLTPGPLETGHISPEEVQQQALRQRFLTSKDFVPEDDEAKLYPQAPVTSFAALGFDESDTRAMGAASISDLVSSSTTPAAKLPPHLRARFSKAVSSAASSAASDAGSSAASTTDYTVSTPTTLREAEADRATAAVAAASALAQRSYNAWGPDGAMQRRQSAASVSSSSAATAATASTTTQNDDPNVVGDWSRVARRAPAPALPMGRKGRFGNGPRLSVLELREACGAGDVYPTAVYRGVDEQRVVRPIGYGDSDSD